MIKASNVDDYIAQSEWKKEVSMLRALIDILYKEKMWWDWPRSKLMWVFGFTTVFF
jgi:hypothetical protein